MPSGDPDMGEGSDRERERERRERERERASERARERARARERESERESERERERECLSSRVSYANLVYYFLKEPYFSGAFWRTTNTRALIFENF